MNALPILPNNPKVHICQWCQKEIRRPQDMRVWNNKPECKAMLACQTRARKHPPNVWNVIVNSDLEVLACYGSALRDMAIAKLHAIAVKGAVALIVLKGKRPRVGDRIPPTWKPEGTY